MDRSWVTSGLDPVTVDALSRQLPASRLWSLLLDIVAQRAAARRPADLMRQWREDRFTPPAYADQRVLHALDAQLLAAASAFEAIELSPVAPLGTSSVLGLTSQHKVLSALRGVEVVSDPTNVLAIEASARLQADLDRVVRLATSHRTVRAQEIPKQPGFAAHFRMFCLATAGIERQGHGLTVGALTEHIATLLDAMDRLERNGYAFPERRITLFAVPARDAVADRVAAQLASHDVRREPLEHAYYGGLRYQISARTTAGTFVPFIDGGTFDWVAQLVSNRRAVFVASGLGSQLATVMYKRHEDA